MFLTIFFFKQQTAYEMRISDWSSDVCSSDLAPFFWLSPVMSNTEQASPSRCAAMPSSAPIVTTPVPPMPETMMLNAPSESAASTGSGRSVCASPASAETLGLRGSASRSEEHTSELQSLMRISYAVFCLKQKKNTRQQDD